MGLQANKSVNTFIGMTKSVSDIVKLCLRCLLVGLFHLRRLMNVKVRFVMTSHSNFFFFNFQSVCLTFLVECKKYSNLDN